MASSTFIMLVPTPLTVRTAAATAGSLLPLPITSTLFRAATAATSTSCTSSKPSPTALADIIQPMIDLARVKTRIEGLQSYGVIAALIMNASLRLYASTPKRASDDQLLENCVKFAFTISNLLSVITGSYTTIVFSLLGLYSKHALGLGMDDKFVEFFDATREIRISGFDSFIICLASFKISFCLSLFLNYAPKSKVRWVVLAVATLCSAYAWHKWSTIMTIAGTILYGVGSGN